MKITKNIIFCIGLVFGNCFSVSDDHVIKFDIFKPNKEIAVVNLKLGSSQSVNDVKDAISKKHFDGREITFYTHAGEIKGSGPLVDQVKKFKSVYVWLRERTQRPIKEIILNSIGDAREAIKNVGETIDNLEAMIKKSKIEKARRDAF